MAARKAGESRRSLRYSRVSLAIWPMSLEASSSLPVSSCVPTPPLSGPRAALLPLAGSSWDRTLSAGRCLVRYVLVLGAGDRYDAVCTRRGFAVVLEDGPYVVQREEELGESRGCGVEGREQVPDDDHSCLGSRDGYVEPSTVMDEASVTSRARPDQGYGDD